jgi:hypothetical protein
MRWRASSAEARGVRFEASGSVARRSWNLSAGLGVGLDVAQKQKCVLSTGGVANDDLMHRSR